MRTISLLTDFGTRDPYVAAMKGVIASRTDARIADLTHDIAPFDVLGAAFFLRGVVPWWPEGTIFVAVIDPGVGSARRILAAERDGRLFLAPDNGVLDFFLDGAQVVSVENEALFLPGGSNTFHGRDRFAPVAAALANGAPLGELGPAIGDPLRLDYREPSYGATIAGTIIAVDRFGNAITDVEAARVPFPPSARVNGALVDRLERTYAGAAPGAFFIVGSTGRLEISMTNDSAADRLHLRRGDPIVIEPRMPS